MISEGQRSSAALDKKNWKKRRTKEVVIRDLA
jgi:hypothetical protein